MMFDRDFLLLVVWYKIILELSDDSIESKSNNFWLRPSSPVCHLPHHNPNITSSLNIFNHPQHQNKQASVNSFHLYIFALHHFRSFPKCYSLVKWLVQHHLPSGETTYSRIRILIQWKIERGMRYRGKRSSQSLQKCFGTDLMLLTHQTLGLNPVNVP